MVLISYYMYCTVSIDVSVDYRIPQMLHGLGCLRYSPPLESHVNQLKPLPSGHRWEIELRGTSIWCVELIRQEIEKRHPEMRGGAFAEAHSSAASQKSDDDANPSADNTTAANTSESQHSAEGDEPEEDEPMGVNAILIDFLLYDTMKTLEKEGKEGIPHHRTRSIWY